MYKSFIKKFSLFIILIYAVSILFSSCKYQKAETNEINNNINENINVESNWDKILKEAKGTTVSFYGWGGSEQTNSWIDNILAPYAKDIYGIEINRVPMNIDEILNKLLSDKENNNDKGSIDLIWINGENFANAKKNGFLYGPFTDELPNFKKYIDENDEEVNIDFATRIEGFESPYGKAQMIYIYDSDKTVEPPNNAQELLEYCKNNPGRFTYEALPGFTGSAFVRNLIYETVGYESLSNLPETITKEEVLNIIKPSIEYMRELNKYLWEEGKTFPATNEIVDSMFMDGILDFSMSYTPFYVPSQIENGQYKDTCKTFLFDKGTVGNTNYVAIAFNSQNKSGAMCLADAILSIPMQVSKFEPKTWGSLPVLSNEKLSNEEKKLFEDVNLGIGAIGQEELLSKRKPELPAYLVTIIEDIWQEEVLGK